MRNKLRIITLEPIEQRYTKQWYNSFKENFSKWFDVIYIDGHKGLEEGIKKGRFLDVNKTNYVKAEQVKKLSLMFQENKIKNGDIFLFMDGWHFGITALKYMAQLNNIKIKIFTYLHAGTWDLHDFITQAGLREWAVGNELGWLRAVDGSFVATEFHKELISKYFNKYINTDKIHVVGFPMDWKKEIDKHIPILPVKENIVVFPHRLDDEKQPHIFNRLAKQLPQYKFIKTLDVTRNKKEYYELLSKAKIVFSASKQETFGIGTVEGLMLGCVPVVPNKLSYKELYSYRFRYKNISTIKKKINFIMKNYGDRLLKATMKKDKEKIRKQSLESFKKMMEVMLK